MPVFRLLLVSLLLSAQPVTAGPWPGFRGDATTPLEAESLPLHWSPTKNVLWKAAPQGYGQSSPVVWDNRVYVTSVSGPNKEEYFLTAFNLENGEQLWQRAISNASPVESSNYVSRAAPTPAADENGIVAFFEGGNLLAFDHQGTTRWERSLAAEFGPIGARHGLGSSLVQSDGTVFVWVERQEDPYLLAVDKLTGIDRWKVAGLGATSWSTPILIEAAGRTQLVLSGNGLVRGIDPQTGGTLWTVEGVSGNSTPSPAPAGEGRMLIAATVARGEQGDGRAAESNGLLHVRRTDDGYDAEFLWRAQRATSSFGSPVAHQGLAYYVNRSGVLFCLDLETGEEVYSARLEEGIWASPLPVGDRIYFIGQKGTTTVVKAGRTFEKLAENRLASADGGETQYAVAAVPGHLLIRCGESVYCIGTTAVE